MRYAENEQYLQARCAHCLREQGEHGMIGSINYYTCPEPWTTTFLAREGDEWCGWCDDWVVNCRCDEDAHDAD